MDNTTVLAPRIRNLGSFEVRRLLPNLQRRMVGPFIFFDHMGPAQFQPGSGVDVRPHPHIGLATVTYLFEGALVHRDSLGTVQRIEPGDVNWMTAGRGIAHSERTAPEDRTHGAVLHGIQSWVALPQAHEDAPPAFSHHSRASLPHIVRPGTELRLVVGTAFGERAPTPTYSGIFYLAGTLQAGSRLDLPPEHEERAIYVVEGDVRIAGRPVSPQHMIVLPARATIALEAVSTARVVMLGGETLDGERHIWWNFVASSRDRIEAAKTRWRMQQFPAIPGESDFIPLPED